MNGSDVKPPRDDTVRAFMGLLSRSGPEMPPDVAGSSDDPAPSRNAVDEPTELLPVITPVAPPRLPPAPKVEARAVIVYESASRRSWGLWVFTAVVVALTAGVVLGQAAAYQPTARSVAAAQTAPPPSYVTPPKTLPNPSGPVPPGPGQPITAPLGSAKTQVLEVTDASALLLIRSADLGPLLFSVATLNGSTTPAVATTSRGPRLSLAKTGTAHIEVQLNSTVSWTIRLTGRSAEQQINMRAGGLAGIELIGDASQTVLELPDPTKTVALRITGTVTKLQIRTGKDTPVRLRLGKGADTATFIGTKRRDVKSGTVLTSAGWRSATHRYDIRTSNTVDSVLVDRAP